MKIKNITILSILTIALLTGCNNEEVIDKNVIANTKTKKETKSNAKAIQQLPVFKLATANGSKIDIEIKENNVWNFTNVKDKVVLLDFFGTWCPPCKAEIPHLNNIRKELKKDFEIVGMDIGKRGGGHNTPEELKQFISEYNIEYPITFGKETGQVFAAVSNLNKNGSIPFMILFDKKGNYVTHYIGMVQEEILINDIKKVIKGI